MAECPIHKKAKQSARNGTPWSMINWYKAKDNFGCLGTECDKCPQRGKKSE